MKAVNEGSQNKLVSNPGSDQGVDMLKKFLGISICELVGPPSELFTILDFVAVHGKELYVDASDHFLISN